MRLVNLPAKVRPETKEKFRKLCNEEGKSMSEVVAEMVEAYCDDVGTE